MTRAIITAIGSLVANLSTPTEDFSLNYHLRKSTLATAQWLLVPKLMYSVDPDERALPLILARTSFRRYGWEIIEDGSMGELKLRGSLEYQSKGQDYLAQEYVCRKIEAERQNNTSCICA